MASRKPQPEGNGEPSSEGSCDLKGMRVPEEHIRRIVQDQIIECLNRFYTIEKKLWGKPINALMRRTIIQGNLQNRHYDISSLSESLNLPLSTIHRKVHELVDGGYVRVDQCGKSMQLIPTLKTEEALNHSFEDMIKAVKDLYIPE